MTRKTLTALLAISSLLLVFAAPQQAQDRQISTRTPVGDRPQDQRQLVVVVEAEKLQKEMVTAYTELEAAIRTMVEFEVVRQGSALKEHAAICESLAAEKTRIAKLSAVEILANASTFPSSAALNRVTEVAHKLRTDPQFHEVLAKAERYYQAGRFPSAAAAKIPRTNSRSLTAAPSFIDPTCDFTDPRDYPSGADIAVPKGLAIVAAAAAEIVPETITVAGFSAPFPLKAVLVGVAAGLEEIVNGFEGAQWDGQWCESIMQAIQDGMSSDEGYLAYLMNDPYLDLVRRVVRAAIDLANGNGIPVQCADTRYNEGVAATSRLEKFKKYRAAYQNIGAANCIQ